MHPSTHRSAFPLRTLALTTLLLWTAAAVAGCDMNSPGDDDDALDCEDISGWWDVTLEGDASGAFTVLLEYDTEEQDSELTWGPFTTDLFEVDSEYTGEVECDGAFDERTLTGSIDYLPPHDDKGQFIWSGSFEGDYGQGIWETTSWSDELDSEGTWSAVPK
jgi:hypothetical protein